MWQHTEKYCLDKLTFIGTSALACQNALKYQLYIKQIFSWIFVICKCALYCCEMPLLSRQWLLIALYTGRFCHLQFCMLFPTKASLRLPTHINIYIYFFVQLFVGKKGAAGITNVWKVIYSIKYVGVFLPLSVPVLSHLCI